MAAVTDLLRAISELIETKQHNGELVVSIKTTILATIFSNDISIDKNKARIKQRY